MYAFINIIGNDRLKESLQRFIRTNRTPHAIIFSGEKGIGKKTVAKTFAKALLCQEKGDEPCGVCLSCRTFESGNHSDVIYIAPSKASIGVDEIRERVARDVYIKPYASEYKLFIIDDADKMTVAAQNAILKTLEDSPGYAVFLLLAQNDGLFLPTVVSRCVLYRLDKLPPNMVLDFIVKNGVENSDAMLIGSFSEGNIGRALALASDPDFAAMRDLASKIIRELKHYDLINVFSMFKAFEPFKERIQEVLDILILCYRDVLIGNFYDKSQKKYSETELCDKIAAVQEAKRRLGRYANFQMTIEALLLKLH